MSRKYFCLIIVSAVLFFASALPLEAQPLRLLFIHHSCGSNWLKEGLRDALQNAGIEVHDATYGDTIGQDTDICHWYSKFKNDMDLVLKFDRHSNRYYGDGRENNIIMFKSCYPLSNIVSEGTRGSANPSDCRKTTANYKAAYTALAKIFSEHPDKLFVIVTAPPLVPSATKPDNARRAIEFNSWLSSDYLNGYYKTYRMYNVAVFDFFGILADNQGYLKYEFRKNQNDSHPNRKANAQASRYFIPFIKEAVEKWRR